MKLKTILSIMLAATLLFTVSYGDAAAAPANVVRLRYGHEATEGHPYDFGARSFKSNVERLTNGEIVVDIFPNGTLGNQSQMVESVSMGLLDFCSTNTPTYEQLVPEFGVLTTPMLFKNYDACLRVMRSEIGDEFKAMTEPHGIKILEWLYMGPSRWNGTFPVAHPNDVKGRKIRIQPGRSYTILGSVLGMIVTPTAFGEVYAALQMGTIENNLQTIMNVYGMKFYEVAPYFDL